MNVLQINSVCGIGSTGRIATDIHNLMISKGHTSTVAYGRDTAMNCSQTICIGRRIDNYLHVAYSRLLDMHGFLSSSATKSFIEKIKVLNPDVIHLHNLHGYYLHIGILFEYLKVLDKPVIWTLHDCWALTGHCTHFDFAGCDRWKHGCYKCPSINEYPKSLIYDNSNRNYKLKKKLFTDIRNMTIVTPSKWLSDIVKESYLKDYPVKVINNGIDLNVFKRTQGLFRSRYGLEGKYIILGVASTWTERKGYQYFVDVSRRLNNDEKIVLVGVDERQVSRLPKGIIGIAKTNNPSELAEIYSDSDIFVNPTLEDNYPTTNLEALACGTPVITFNSGGSTECLNDECGMVVERGDLNGLIDAIRVVRKNGKNIYVKKCMQRARRLFDKDDRFAEYVKLYDLLTTY